VNRRQRTLLAGGIVALGVVLFSILLGGPIDWSWPRGVAAVVVVVVSFAIAIYLERDGPKGENK